MRRNLKTVLDLGDIVGVTGGIRKTDRGEVSVTATSIQVSLQQAYSGLS